SHFELENDSGSVKLSMDLAAIGRRLRDARGTARPWPQPHPRDRRWDTACAPRSLCSRVSSEALPTPAGPRVLWNALPESSVVSCRLSPFARWPHALLRPARAG